MYPEIVEAEFNPLVHDLRHGQTVGRDRLGSDQPRRWYGSARLRRDRATAVSLT